MPVTDQLVRAAIAGDPAARAAVSRWLLPQLHWFFSNRFHSVDVIDDLTQATMVQVWIHAANRSPRNAAGFLDWVYGVGGMTAKATRTKIARKHAGESKYARLRVPEWVRSLSSTLGDARAWRTIERCIARLATPYREAVQNQLDGGSPARLAAAREVPVGTIWWRYSEAVRRIKLMIARGDVMADSLSS